MRAHRGLQRLDRLVEIEDAGHQPVAERAVAQDDDAGVVATDFLDDIGNPRPVDDQAALAPGGDVPGLDLRPGDRACLCLLYTSDAADE